MKATTKRLTVKACPFYKPWYLADDGSVMYRCTISKPPQCESEGQNDNCIFRIQAENM